MTRESAARRMIFCCECNGYSKARLTDGREYHTAELRTLDEARAVYEKLLAIKKERTVS